MRKTAAVLVLIAAGIAAGFAPGLARADDMAAGYKHRHAFARGCGFEGRRYGDGQFCTLTCRGGACATQTCRNGRWVIPPATCPRGFGCPAFC